MHVIPPGGTIGIMGGGQLGRMTALAAARLGYHTHIYCPEADSPAAQVSNHVTVAPYDDRGELEKFAAAVDIVSFEFENVPSDTARILEKSVTVRPGWRALHVAQHRVREKGLCAEIGVPTNRHVHVRTFQDLLQGYEALGERKAILKTVSYGYDGKGQVVLKPRDNIEALWRSFGERESILEEFVDFAREISVIVARGQDARTAVFPAAENRHEGGILRTSAVPAAIAGETLLQAQNIAVKLAEELHIVGLLAVEFFVLKDGGILVNEIAPRPHNSGHWTMDGCVTSQFEQFVRAICGLSLGSVDMLAAVRMENLIGGEVERWREILRDPAAKLHLYGKREARPGRKMGHVNHVRPFPQPAKAKRRKD